MAGLALGFLARMLMRTGRRSQTARCPRDRGDNDSGRTGLGAGCPGRFGASRLPRLVRAHQQALRAFCVGFAATMPMPTIWRRRRSCWPGMPSDGSKPIAAFAPGCSASAGADIARPARLASACCGAKAGICRGPGNPATMPDPGLAPGSGRHRPPCRRTSALWLLLCLGMPGIHPCRSRRGFGSAAGYGKVACRTGPGKTDRKRLGDADG